MKKAQLFLILGIVSVSLGGVVFIVGAVLTLLGNASLGDLIMGLSSLFGVAALVLLIFRLYFMAKDPDVYPECGYQIIELKYDSDILSPVTGKLFI